MSMLGVANTYQDFPVGLKKTTAGEIKFLLSALACFAAELSAPWLL
jgi:hypothetical protein